MTVAIETGQSGSPQTRAGILRCLNSPACYWAMLVLYLLAHVALQIWSTPNIGKNEVQEAIAAQSWAWGYHPRNPPLHTWLLLGAYSIFGVNALAHAVLKYVLLGALYTFAYLSGRRLIPDHTLAALSALSLILLSPFAWTVHTALTHTLLLAVVVFATFWSALRLVETRTTRAYALFGLFLGLGLLAKYSFFLFALPLLAALLTIAPLRSAILNPRFLLSIAIAAAVFAPHGAWMLDARYDFGAFLAESEHIDSLHSYPMDLALGFGDFATEVVEFLLPFGLAFPLVFLSRRAKEARTPSPWSRVATLTAAYSLGLLALNIIVFRATHYELRYMLCALLLAPLASFLWLKRRSLSSKRLAIYFGVILIAALIGFGGVIGRGLIYHRSCDRCWEEMPIAPLAESMRAAGFKSGTIIASDYNVAGNMRLAFPTARIYAANYHVAQPPFEGDGRCLLIWNVRVYGEATPARLSAYLQERGIAPTHEITPEIFEAPLRRSHDRLDRFAFWIVPGADGSCRLEH